MTVNESLQVEAVRHAIDLQQFSNGEARRIIALLNRADADLVSRLEAALTRLDGSSYTIQHMEAVLASVRELNRAVYAEAKAAMGESAASLAVVESEYQFTALSSALPAEIAAMRAVTAVSFDQVRQAAMSRPFQGRLLAEWFDSLEADRAARIRDTIRIGMVEGQTTSQIVRRIRGTKALGYADGILNRSRNDIESVVRTAIGHVTSTVQDEFSRQNADIIKADRWLSTLDTRTSETCRVRSGKLYEPVTHKPIDHSLPWLGGPGKAHWGCRSVRVYVTKSFRELGIDMDEVSPSTQSSMDGQVPADLTYGEWLKTQSAARQDSVLGPTRGRLFRAGGLTIDRFYNDKGRFLTLDQLRERSADAFAAAGV